MDSFHLYHLDQGLPIEYELDTFNTPPQEQLYVTPKIGYVDAMPSFCSRHLALISPLGHLNGDNARLSTRRTKLTVTPTATRLSLNYGKHNPSHIWRYALPSQLYHISILSLTHKLSYETCNTQTQTKYSMLQIKPIPKNISTSTSWTFSFIYPTSFSEGLTHLARKQLNGNTHTHVTPSSLLKTQLSLAQ